MENGINRDAIHCNLFSNCVLSAFTALKTCRHQFYSFFDEPLPIIILTSRTDGDLLTSRLIYLIWVTWLIPPFQSINSQ
jgi:hypothetical protein